MSEVNLINDGEQIITGNDNIVIVRVTDTVRGGRSLDVAGFAPEVINAGHVIIKNDTTGDHKPMPVVEASAGNVATFGAITAGATYTNGTYENVPLTGGSGSGALATVVVSGNVVTAVTKTRGGKDYKVGDVLSADADTVGGTGTGFSIPVATVASTTGVYKALPAGHSYVGVLIASILKKRAFAAIMTIGTMNPVPAPYDFATIATAFRAAVPLIDQRAD